MCLNLFFFYDFDGTLYLSHPVHANPHLPKAALPQNTPNLVLILDILHFFEAFVVLEIEDVEETAL